MAPKGFSCVNSLKLIEKVATKFNGIVEEVNLENSTILVSVPVENEEQCTEEISKILARRDFWEYTPVGNVQNSYIPKSSSNR